MKLNVAAPIATPMLLDMLKTVGAEGMAQGTVYTPFMQLLLAPAQESENGLAVWELTQKLYQHKDGEVDLSEKEVEILKSKAERVNLLWLRARLLEVLT